MNDRRNVIVMFLLIMLSFAIITEVSAASEAEINGTGSNPSMMSNDIPNHDFASERNNENQMQNHFDTDDFQSHDGQKSFNKTPEDFGDNKCNEILYEHDMDLKPIDNPQDLNQSFEFKSEYFKPVDNVSVGMSDNKKPLNLNNNSGFKFDEKPAGDNNFHGLRNDSFTNHSDDELMEDVVSNLIGLNNIAPNFKKDDRNVSPNIITDHKPAAKNSNVSAPAVPGEKNSSDIGSVDIEKNIKTQKSVKKTKHVKKLNKKVKSIKKPKKVNKKLSKKFKKERAKL